MMSKTSTSAHGKPSRRRRVTISLYNVGTGLFWVAIGVFIAGLFGFLDGRFTYWALLCAGLIALILAQIRRHRGMAYLRNVDSDPFAPPPRAGTPLLQEIASGVVLSVFVAWLMKSFSPELGMVLTVIVVGVAAALQPPDGIESVASQRRISAMESEVQAALAHAQAQQAEAVDRSVTSS